MSIVTLYKVTLFGPLHQKAEVIDKVQGLAALHLLPLRAQAKDGETEPDCDQAIDAYKALRYLNAVQSKRRPVNRDEAFDMRKVVADVLANQERLRQVEDKRDALAERIKALRPWGNFEHVPNEQLGGLHLWFYVVPLNQVSALDGLELPWQMVHRDNRFAYVVVIAAQEPASGVMPVPRTHTGSLPLKQVIRAWERAEIELEEVNAERQCLTRWIDLIASRLHAAEDRAARVVAAQQTWDDEALFVLQGWAPEPRLQDLRDFAQEQGLAIAVEQGSADDQPPTLLSNPPAVAAGQDLVDFYQIPGYHAWDPSRVVFPSFALFFAMILSDAGYAALLGLGLLAFWGRLGTSEGGKRARVLISTLCVGSLAWGISVGSYFGVGPPQGSLLAALKFMDINDFDLMMRLSVVIGVSHIALANAVMARQYWGDHRAWMSLGWIAALLGGLLFWLAGDSAPGRLLAQVLLLGGLLGVLLFGSARRVKRKIDWLWRLLDGLGNLTNVTKLFGDVLSYLRLFALGLASASLALTFNDLARQVAEANPGVGLLFSLLILLVGHALNLALSLMSGVVHGLRLNFIEFYNWGLSEEGYPFRAFAKKEVGE